MAGKKTAKKAVEETAESKIAEISKEITRVTKESQSIVVNTREDYESASKFLSGVVKPRIKRIEELVKFFTKPHQDARKKALEEMKKIEELFATQLAPLQNIETTVKKAMGGFLRLEEEARLKEEKRLQALREKQDARREEKGLEPIATPLPTIERPDATVKNEEGGKTTATKVWKFKIIDIDQVPRQYLRCEVKHAEVIGAISMGVREIAGLEIYEEFDIRASTK